MSDPKQEQKTSTFQNPPDQTTTLTEAQEKVLAIIVPYWDVKVPITTGVIEAFRGGWGACKK